MSDEVLEKVLHLVKNSRVGKKMSGSDYFQKVYNILSWLGS